MFSFNVFLLLKPILTRTFIYFTRIIQERIVYLFSRKMYDSLVIASSSFLHFFMTTCKPMNAAGLCWKYAGTGSISQSFPTFFSTRPQL